VNDRGTGKAPFQFWGVVGSGQQFAEIVFPHQLPVDVEAVQTLRAEERNHILTIRYGAYSAFLKDMGSVSPLFPTRQRFDAVVNRGVAADGTAERHSPQKKGEFTPHALQMRSGAYQTEVT
jgi:hypothetical protein